MSIYKIYEEYKKKGMDSIKELSDMFECLALFYRDLDKNYQVLLEELNIIKAEFGNSKRKSKIKWNFDFEQKGADIRDLLIADCHAPFVDISSKKVIKPDDDS